MTRVRRPRTAVAVALIALTAPVAQATRPATGPQRRAPMVAAVEAPAGTDLQGVQWVKVTTPELGTMLAAVARPAGAGPFPALVILHGSHGFAREYVRLAQSMAQNGITGVAACWFTGGGGVGARFVTPIPCPQAPAMAAPTSPNAQRTVDALVQAVRSMPGVRGDRIALFGHSRGGGAALHYVLGAGSVWAAVLDSAGYPEEVADRASRINVPILMFHGTADNPADGGSESTRVEAARRFEAALKRAGKQIEARYYEGAGHNGIFTSATQYDDEVQRIAAFMHRR
jgi:dienelactone hydrolase